MNSIILAAGYGTRLGKLVEKKAKPLLAVGGIPLLTRLILKILRLSRTEAVFLVVNDRYFRDFVNWKKEIEQRENLPFPIHLINDGTRDNSRRLGALRDLDLGIRQAGEKKPLLVSAADDIFLFDFRWLEARFLETGRTTIALTRCHDNRRLRQSGNACIDSQGRVAALLEKPDNPVSDLIAPCLYILAPADIPLLSQYLVSGNNPDAPGHFISWLVKRSQVYSFLFKEPFYTIGTPLDYREAEERCYGTEMRD
jgi:glucose-1-phosphate thymidylyltransferase